MLKLYGVQVYGMLYPWITDVEHYGVPLYGMIYPWITDVEPLWCSSIWYDISLYYRC